MKKKLVMMTLASCILASTFSLTVCAEPVEVEAGVIFDAEYYAETNPDVVNALGDDEDVLYEHYKLYGAGEGRLPYSPTTSKEDLEKAKKAKKVKKVKTKQKLDEEKIRVTNEYEGYEYYVRYAIYDDEKIDAELKALNEYRKSKKLPELKINKKLNKAAAILALEYTLGADYEKDGVIISGMYNGIRPNGKSSTTVFKECGIKGVKSSTELNVKYSGKNEGFIDTLTGDYYSMYSKELNSKKYTEVGIGYYSSADGSLQTWVMLPVQK